MTFLHGFEPGRYVSLVCGKSERETSLFLVRWSPVVALARGLVAPPVLGYASVDGGGDGCGVGVDTLATCGVGVILWHGQLLRIGMVIEPSLPLHSCRHFLATAPLPQYQLEELHVRCPWLKEKTLS